MATAKSDAKLREVYMKKEKADLINIALDQVDTIKQLRGINAELSKRLKSKIQELEGEITRLKTFSEAAAQAVLKLTNQPRSRSQPQPRPRSKVEVALQECKRELDEELERELRKTNSLSVEVKALREYERELDEELERELRETQRMGSMQRRFAEQELARQEAGRNAVITHFESQAPDAPTPVSASDVAGQWMHVEERKTVYPYHSSCNGFGLPCRTEETGTMCTVRQGSAVGQRDVVMD
jgi:hypothetical protein